MKAIASSPLRGDRMARYRFEKQTAGMGCYFRTALYSDIESLGISVGVHAGRCGPSLPAHPVDFAAIAALVQRHCVGGHAEHPTQPGFAATPKGYRFDTAERIHAQAAVIGRQVATGAMPLGNLTTMTADERAAVVAWINAGAPP